MGPVNKLIDGSNSSSEIHEVAEMLCDIEAQQPNQLASDTINELRRWKLDTAWWYTPGNAQVNGNDKKSSAWYPTGNYHPKSWGK